MIDTELYENTDKKDAEDDQNTKEILYNIITENIIYTRLVAFIIVGVFFFYYKKHLTSCNFLHP